MLAFIVFVIAIVACAFALKAMNEVAALRTRLDALERANAAAARPASPPPLAPHRSRDKSAGFHRAALTSRPCDTTLYMTTVASARAYGTGSK